MAKLYVNEAKNVLYWKFVNKKGKVVMLPQTGSI